MCLWETVHCCLPRADSRGTLSSQLVGRAGRLKAGKKKSYTWFEAATDFSRFLFRQVVAHVFCVAQTSPPPSPLSDMRSLFAGQWAVLWSWIPTASAGRRSVWRGSRLSCARPSRKLSVKWPKEPGSASGSASTSSGTGAGTAPATINTLAKYFSKVGEYLIYIFLSSKCAFFPEIVEKFFFSPLLKLQYVNFSYQSIRLV